MAMVKVISPQGWDFDGPIARPLKLSSRGLLGNDRKDFLKYASHTFLPYIDEIKIAKDEEPVHLISHGATEGYGPNRNGDGFKEATCRRYHDTFEKYARHYRNHQNKDPATSYGLVKKSAYNEPMRRVELLVAMNASKEAAERNGGHIADKELEKLARNEDIPFSMSCRVSHDVCSWCGNNVRTRDDYCTASTCKAGGCKDNLTRLIKMGNDVHQLHVDNPHPIWFDISTVFRPADRIAYGTRADYLTKAACADFNGGMVGSAKIAEDLGVVAPLAVILAQEAYTPLEFSSSIDQQIKLAYGLSALEKRPSLAAKPLLKRAFDARVQGTLDTTALGVPGTQKCAESLAALADECVILPLREFAKLAGREELTHPAQERLAGVYSRMEKDGSLERRVRGSKYPLSTKSASYKVKMWASRMREGFSLEKSAVDRRCQLSTLRRLSEPFSGKGKSAGDNQSAEELARDYAVYKVAALQRIAGLDSNFTLTVLVSAVQNSVS